MLAHRKNEKGKGKKQHLAQAEDADRGQDEELRDEQLKKVAGGIDPLSWRKRTGHCHCEPKLDEGG